MAFTYSTKEIAHVPWLIREIDVTVTEADGGALTHGGPAAEPDIVLVTDTTAAVGGSQVSVSGKSTTTVTVDCEADSKACKIYCIWFAQADADGGLDAPS